MTGSQTSSGQAKPSAAAMRAVPLPEPPAAILRGRNEMTDTLKAAQTPGPWRSERITMSKYNIDAYFEVLGGPTEDETVGVFPREVCQTIMREIGTEDALLTEDEANVHLIAMAPELLAELQDAHTHLIGMAAYLATCATAVIVENLETTIAALHNKADKFEAIIRKARGES